MRLSLAPICCCALLLPGRPLPAQQQTGAPAGISVPPAPADKKATAANAAAGPAVFRVHVLDGRNGAPMSNAHVKLWYDEPAGSGYEVATDAHGYGNMPAPVGEPVRVLVRPADYTDCRKPLRGDPPEGYNLASIAKSGVRAENTCGEVPVRPQPGELILFVRPAHWYEGINRGAGN